MRHRCVCDGDDWQQRNVFVCVCVCSGERREAGRACVTQKENCVPCVL